MLRDGATSLSDRADEIAMQVDDTDEGDIDIKLRDSPMSNGGYYSPSSVIA